MRNLQSSSNSAAASVVLGSLVRLKSAGKLYACAAAALAAAVLISQQARAAEGCEFFAGKTVELVVPFSAGGGFDVYGRMVAKFMGPELGAANMIVRNQPGAGGLLGTNQTWNAKADGLRIQLMSASGMITSELGGADGVAFKSGEFSWIGRISGEPDIVSTAPGSAVKNFADIQKLAEERRIRIGSSGVGDIDYIEAFILNEMLDDKADVITGFSGSGEVFASLGRGELDLFSSSLTSAIPAQKAETARPLFVFAAETADEMPDVKPISELVDAKFLPMIETQARVVAAGRALAGPPEVPDDRLKCLRDAFDRAMASEGLLAESKKLNRPVYPLNGVQMTSIVTSATDGAPQEYLDLVKKAAGK